MSRQLDSERPRKERLHGRAEQLKDEDPVAPVRPSEKEVKMDLQW